MKKSSFITLSLVMCFLLAAGSAARADTIRLFEGSVMVGKILSEDKAAIILANSYGTFRIKRIKIDDIYKTNSYAEDIAIHKKMKFPVNEGEIKRNYTAGQDRKDGKKVEPIRIQDTIPEKAAVRLDETVKADRKESKTGTEKKEAGPGDDHWKSGRFSFSGAALYNLEKGSGYLPNMFGGYVAFDQGLDFASGDRHPLIPGLRFEGGFYQIKYTGGSIKGFLAAGGLMWAFPSMNNSWGCITLALLPGASFFNLKFGNSYLAIGNSKAALANFAAQAILGYQKSWGVFSLFVQARGLYIMSGHGSDLYSVGGELGFGFNAW